MNNLTTPAGLPAFDGTAALSARSRRPRLVLIEGGRTAEGASDVARRPQELSLRQSALFVACGVALVCALALASVVSDALRAQGGAASLSALPTETVVVQEGDSLWGIAEGRIPQGVSTAELVSWIQERNGLTGGLVTPGQRLQVPVASLG
ncbi:LysM peptidoglycan-binding domain-containing protein [Olsenella profusa]|uniref:LysM peptidoglycan-binding domain-containing protein n=1 Tax=Olsenella profusa TaxID=138595 RepID=A0ABS2F2S0_9ACTN|nr:LysM peptidoglycan-binding domain-containing protein [Olsenella profusa]MBM6775284.1 LysM peptidoglycan-binding domain-containing protein [Olsenella profusa]